MLKLLGPRIFIKHISMASASSSIIYLDHLKEEVSQFGVVLAVGNGERTQYGRRKIPIGVGDTVIVSRFSSAPIDTIINGSHVEGHIVMEEDVLCIVEEL